MKKQKNKSNQGSSNVWTVVVFVIIIVLIIGGGLYIWKKYNLQTRQSLMKEEISSLQNRINQLEKAQTEKCEPEPVKENTSKQESEQVAQEEESMVKNVILENGAVYYVNENDEKRLVVKSVDDKTDLENVNYEKAELSPDKKFILLGSKGLESVNVEIYDVSTKKIHKANASGSGYGEWLTDGKLKVVGECGMGISCGIYESADSDIPWVLEKIQDF